MAAAAASQPAKWDVLTTFSDQTEIRLETRQAACRMLPGGAIVREKGQHPVRHWVDAELVLCYTVAAPDGQGVVARLDPGCR